jgi:glycosyltransferase involved in cell wall biosynthesis
MVPANRQAAAVASSPLRVLALMESTQVGGPAKNLIQMATIGRQPPPGVCGLEVAFVTFQRGGAPETPFMQAVRKAGLPLHLLREERRFDLGPLQQLRALAREWQPHVVQTHNIKSHFFMRIVGLPRTYPWVAFQHGYTNTDWKDRTYSLVDRWSLPGAHRVVAVCQAFAERLEQDAGVRHERLRVQHNSVRTFVRPAPEDIAALRDHWKLGNDLAILVVGRLSFEKGHADLIEALPALARQVPHGWRIVLAGDGPERANLETQATRLGVRDKLVLAGHQQDLRMYYGMADLLALPSHTEGSPNVVLEAMAVGLPMAAAKVGGVPEILTHEVDALLLPSRDPQAMAAALARLLTDEPLRQRLGSTAQRLAAERYSPEAKYADRIALYEELLRERARQ